MITPLGPLRPSPHSQQQSSPWDYSPIPMSLLLATTLTRGPVSLFGVHRAVVQIVWFSLYSDHHRSAASLSNSLKCLRFVPNYCFTVGISPLLQFLHPQVQVQFHSLSSFSIPCFNLTSFAWIYIFLSSSQGRLATLSWCSVRFSSSEDVFLMHPWREKYSRSIYSSAILLSHWNTFYYVKPHDCPIDHSSCSFFFNLSLISRMDNIYLSSTLVIIFILYIVLFSFRISILFFSIVSFSLLRFLISALILTIF